MTITGTNLTGASAVNFGAVAGTIVSINSGTSITATSPAGSAGAVDVIVTNAFGTSAASSGDEFTYVSQQMLVIPKTTVPGPGIPTLAIYNVTYNGNGNTWGSVPVDSSSPYSASKKVTVLGNTGNLVKTGYTFASWNTAADGSGTSYNAGSTFTMGTASVTLYAQWTLAITYTVNYNGNGSTGGSVPVDSNSPYSAGTPVTVLGNRGNLAETGYNFVGWNTAADGSGTSYQPNSTFTMGTASVTLYAQWTPWTDITFNGGFNQPNSVAVDGAGNVYVADSYHGKIKELKSGSTSWNDITGNGGFIIPWGVAVDGAGDVYVSDSASFKAIKKLPYGQTSWTDITGNGGFRQVFGVAVDGAGNIYVADNGGWIKKLPHGQTSWTDINGNIGKVSPWGLAVDGAGNVYMTDAYNIKIWELKSGSTTWTDVTNGGFNGPSGVAVDGAGNVYMADTGNNDKIWELKSGSTSWTDVTGNGGFNGPSGVAVDGAGNVYVADTGNNKIKEMLASATTVTPGTSTAPSTTPSATTLQLTATGGNGSVTLNWTAPSYSGKTVSGFYPYRGTTAGGESSNPLTDFPVTSSSFTDQAAQLGTTYYYILKPVFSDDSQGAASNEASATATGTIVLVVGNPDMTVNGVSQPIDSSGTAPVIVDSRVFVPISAIIQAMGGTVAWNAANQQVTITLNGTTIVLTINSTTAQVNGSPQTMDVAPYISSTGRTMMPLSFITDNLGCTTNWNGANDSVTINYT